MRKLVLVVLLLLLTVPCLAQLTDLQPLAVGQTAVKWEAPEITNPNFSVAGVRALTQVKIGACLSYKLVRWKEAALHVDVGVMFDPIFDFNTIDGFTGLSTNIKPVDEWLERAFSLDTRWGVGWLFRANDPFFYMAADIGF